MIGLDTDVLVRYLAQDDPVQSAQANQVIDQLTAARPGFVSTVTMAETYWVLCRAYRTDRRSAAAVLEALVGATEVTVESVEPVRRALRRVAAGADFADALIAELGADAGCEHTVTFDRKAARSAGMRLVGAG